MSAAPNLRFELTGAADESRYLLRSQMDILHILRELMRRRSLVTMYYGDLNDFILTSVLGISNDQRTVFLDCAPRAALNERIAAAGKLVFVSSHDKVKVQFVATGARLRPFENSSAFAVAMPDALLRLQRREYFRMVTPVVHPLKCVISLPGDDGFGRLQLAVHDLSLGGIAVITHPHEMNFAIGAKFDDCTISLPDGGIVHAAIEIKNTFEVTLASGAKTKRTGFEFVDLPERMHGMIQRYIMKLERERRAKGVGAHA